MSQDFKDTLNLPKTGFPMRANLVAREPERLSHWHREDVYGRAIKTNREGKVFLLHDGPPFTNGHVHIGTALNKVLKDIVIRYNLARGKYAPFVPGWDCHGLPIEAKVMRQLQEEKRELPAHELREACAEFSRSYMSTMRAQFQRLGVVGDWEHEYRTMDPAYEAEVLRALAAFVEKGFVYRSKKPVYWSIPCETALAEAEIEYRPHTSPSIWAGFPVTGNAPPGLENSEVVIWTTTPWTLPANLAVVLHPNLNYVLVTTGGKRYLVAEDLVASFASECNLGACETGAKWRGEELTGVVTRHPFIDRTSPILMADYVTLDAGTGCVHTAPGHGMEDYQTGLKYGLEVYCPLNDRGEYLDDGQIPPSLVGLTVLENASGSPANRAVLDLLRSSGHLVHSKSYEHSYPHCWRSKTPVIFRAMDQWFISVDNGGLRDQALETLSEVRWLPAWGENRIRGAVASKPDWCISRQRQWGVPIPAFYDEEGNPCLSPELIRAVADRAEKEGISFWFKETATELAARLPLPEDWTSRKLRKSTDTLDVWIESGSSHLAVLARYPGLQWPADLYLEGSDQHRGWFQSSLWTALVCRGRPPYRAILTHGFVVGEDGRKISKSDGKPQNADDYIRQYGADVLRLWIASEDFRNDIPVSDNILRHIGETYRLLRNTLRFQLSNLYDFDARQDALPLNELHVLDKWILDKAAKMADSLGIAYEEYEFHKVYQLLNQFCAVTLSSIYHDIVKDRLYTLAANAPLRRSTQTALHHLLQFLLRTMAPILPFTTDEALSHLVYGDDYGPEGILDLRWPENWNEWKQEEAALSVDLLLALRPEVNECLEACRRKSEIGKSLDAVLFLHAGSEHPSFPALAKYSDFLPEFFIVSEVNLKELPSADLKVEAFPSPLEKCPRCWRRVLPSGIDTGGAICPRCEEALTARPTLHSN